MAVPFFLLQIRWGGVGTKHWCIYPKNGNWEMSQENFSALSAHSVVKKW